MTLDQLARNTQATVTAVRWDSFAPDEAKRLSALGLDDGAEVSITHRGIFGTRDPLALRLGSMTIAIRRAHAELIEVAASDKSKA